MRLFVAVEIPAAVRDRIMALVNDLREAESGAPRRNTKWVRAENLHVTLKFIGHVEPAKLEPIRTVLSQVRSDAPVDVTFRSIGFFPNEKRPRVVWVGVEASPNLVPLAKQIDKRLAALDIEPEDREFTPHLTLARFDPPGISQQLRGAIQSHAGTHFGALHTNTFHLIESKLKPSGAEYTTLQSFCFAAEA